MTQRRLRLAACAVLAMLDFAISVAAEPPQLPSPPPALSGGPISVQVNAEGTLLVVTDQPREALAIYRIDGNVVKLLDVRRLDRDFAVEAPKESGAAPAGPPSKDVPGQDPPNFVRPQKAVRLSSNFNDNWGGKMRWRSEYAVPGTVDETYTKIRAGYKDWKATSESSDPDRVSFKVSNDNRDVEIRLEQYRRAPGWSFVEVVEERRPN